MHEALEQWIDENLRQPGIRAFGVRLPDQTCFSHSYSADYPEDRLTQIWHQLAETVAVFATHRVPANRLRWTYQNAHIHFAIRPDGIALGLFTAVSPVDHEAATIERLLEEFLNLKNV